MIKKKGIEMLFHEKKLKLLWTGICILLLATFTAIPVLAADSTSTIDTVELDEVLVETLTFLKPLS